MDNSLVSRPGMAGVRFTGQRRLKDPCEIVRAKTTPTSFGGSQRTYTVVGQYKCDVISRNSRTSGSENQNREIGLYDVHLPVGAVLKLSDRLYKPGYVPEWKPGTAYASGALVTPPLGQGVGDGFFYVCSLAGTSGTTSPFDEASMLGGTVTDNVCRWIVRDRLVMLEPVADEIPALSNQGTLVVVCKVIT